LIKRRGRRYEEEVVCDDWLDLVGVSGAGKGFIAKSILLDPLPASIDLPTVQTSSCYK